MLLLPTHPCPYFTVQLRRSQPSRSYWKPSFPVLPWQCQEHKHCTSVPWAESWEVTPGGDRAPGSVCPLQFHPQELLWVPLLSAGDTRVPRSVPRARMVPASQGSSCPRPAWARHCPQGSAARAPPVLQTTEWHCSITHKRSHFYNCLSKWCIKWKDNLFL